MCAVAPHHGYFVTSWTDCWLPILMCAYLRERHAWHSWISCLQLQLVLLASRLSSPGSMELCGMGISGNPNCVPPAEPAGDMLMFQKLPCKFSITLYVYRCWHDRDALLAAGLLKPTHKMVPCAGI